MKRILVLVSLLALVACPVWAAENVFTGKTTRTTLAGTELFLFSTGSAYENIAASSLPAALSGLFSGSGTYLKSDGTKGTPAGAISGLATDNASGITVTGNVAAASVSIGTAGLSDNSGILTSNKPFAISGTSGSHYALFANPGDPTVTVTEGAFSYDLSAHKWRYYNQSNVWADMITGGSGTFAITSSIINTDTTLNSSDFGSAGISPIKWTGGNLTLPTAAPDLCRPIFSRVSTGTRYVIPADTTNDVLSWNGTVLTAGHKLGCTASGKMDACSFAANSWELMGNATCVDGGVACLTNTITITGQPTTPITVGGSNGSTGTATSTYGIPVATSDNTGYMTVSGSATTPVSVGTAHVLWDVAAGGGYCAAAQQQSNAITVSAAAACADSSCSGFLICQNFETPTTGYDNSESWSNDGSATPNPVYTATYLRGSQSLYLPDTGDIYNNLGSDHSTVYFHIQFRGDAVNQATYYSQVIALKDSTDTGLMSVGIYNSKLYINNSTAGTTTLSNNTTYHLWGQYTAGTGANAVLNVWLGTSATMPGTPEIAISNGTQTAGVHLVHLGSAHLNTIIDQVLVKTTSIGSVCTP